jgi:HemY protein
MRIVVWLVGLFVVAVVAANTLGRNDGLVSLYWGGWRTDLSLNLAVLLVAGSMVLLFGAVRAIDGMLSLPRRAGEWRALRRERIAQQALRGALAEFFAGRYARARRAAEKALVLQDETPQLRDDLEFRLLALLLAAGSLHRLQDRDRRDEVMRTLQSAVQGRAAVATSTATRSAEEGAVLLAAEWALDDRDPPRALQALATLAPGAARRMQALKLRLQAARAAQQPLQALQTARLLANHQAFSPAVAASLLRSLAGEVLEQAHDLQQLRRLWGALDAADRRDVQVAARAAARAVALGAPDDARQWLKPFWDRLADLPREDRDTVSLALLEARSGIGPEWLPRLEAAAQAYGQEPALVAAVGAAFAERQLWGKARPLLSQAANAAALPPRVRRGVWRELARLAREEGDDARALDAEHAAAALD